MSRQKVDSRHIYHLAVNEAYVSADLMRLNRKIREIEKILHLSLQEKRESFSVRHRLLKAVAERRLTLNFLKQTNREKYLRVLKILSLVGDITKSRS